MSEHSPCVAQMCRSRSHLFGSTGVLTYEVHQVGGQTILEYWIPAEGLEAMNENIVGQIEVVAEYL